MCRPRRLGSRALCASLLLLAAARLATPAYGQTPLPPEAHTLAAASVGVPIEHTFSVATAGTYTITLTDLGASLPTPAPLASVTLAVTSGTAVVGTPLVGAGTLTVTALPAGTYVLHVVGTPGNVPGSGPIGILVDASDMTQLAAFQDVIALPSQLLPNGEAALSDSFTVPGTASNYTVALNDLQLPQSLTTLTLLIVSAGGTVPVVTLPSNGSYTASNVSLAAGVTYQVFAVGQANSTVNAGLYSAVVTAGTGPVVFARTVPVGATQHLGSPVLAAGTATLTLGDLAFPAALSQLAAALLLNGQPVAQLAGAGSQGFTAVAGTYDAYGAGTAGASGAGSYALEVDQGTTNRLSAAQGVTAQGGALSSYAFQTSIAAAGAATVSLTDFQFPAALASVSLAATQGGALLGTPLSAAGSLPITAAAGPLWLVVFAHPAVGGGLFGIDVTASGASAPEYAVTQAVGALFNAQQFDISAAGSYSVTATDLSFPATFTNYATIVTQGTTQLGSIFGGGTFNFSATPGTYFINFIAQPAAPANAGTYGLTVTATPPAPVVTLSVDRPQISSGGTVDVIWSSQNATSCTASGGWSGMQALSGTVTSAALSSNTTFTLSCTGPGGTTQQSVQVTVTASSGGGGGGGAVDAASLLALAAALAMRRGRSACRGLR